VNVSKLSGKILYFCSLGIDNKKNPDSSPASKYLGEELPGLHGKSTKKWNTTSNFLKKYFPLNEWSGIFCFIRTMKIEQSSIMNVI
jgi:hypothetical protein